MSLLVALLNRRSEVSIRNGVLLYKQLIRPLISEDYRCCNPSFFVLLRAPFGTSVIGKFTNI
jgi:hypothetical protein